MPVILAGINIADYARHRAWRNGGVQEKAAVREEGGPSTNRRRMHERV
jgi:hypothetical protein